MPSEGSIRVAFPFMRFSRMTGDHDVWFQIQRSSAVSGKLRIGYIRAIHARLSRTPCSIRIPAALSLDTWCFRTRDEIPYCDQLATLDVSVWDGYTIHVSQAALCWESPLLRHEFRYLSREGTAFDVAVKWKRRFRRRTGYLVPYQCVEPEKLTSQTRASRYVAQTPHWEMIEVSNYAHVGLPPCITYVGSRLKQDVTSGWWVVAYSKYVAGMAVLALQEVYETQRIWRFSKRVCRYMRQLDISLVLGSRTNYGELLKYVSLIEGFNLGSPAATAQSEGTGIYGGIGTEYFLYNPWTESPITVAEAKALREDPPLMPADHETGFSFDSQGGDAQGGEVQMGVEDDEGGPSHGWHEVFNRFLRDFGYSSQVLLGG